MAYLSFLFLTVYGFALIFCVRGWTYHYSPYNMNYDDAYRYCTEKYTSMVAIQNQKENEHLNIILPFNKGYYWIGIRKNKSTGNWTWVGTNKVLTKEATNWAEKEPNNLSDSKNEDCVEMYVKRATDTGQWNDEPCSKEKAALCYKASCHTSSCNNHGECVETINNYTCNCYDGFYGDECEHVVTCPEINGIDHGSIKCSHVNGNFTYQSNCNFNCSDGYVLLGSQNVSCTKKGDWRTHIPHCKEIQCKRPEVPLNGMIRCSNDGELLPDKSMCNFSCDEGFRLVGSSSVLCMTPGQWTEEPPKCNAILCERPKEPENGVMDCSDHEEILSYKSRCNFRCNEGFTLVGSSSTTCMSSHQWTEKPPKCEAIQCHHPEVPKNGSMQCSSNEGSLLYMSSCIFTCNEGFNLVGSPKTLCKAPDQWTKEPPKCEAIQCKIPEEPQNGTMSCTDSGEMLPQNSVCNFSCTEGFTLTGSSTILCAPPGHWTGGVPKCEAVQCPSLVAPTNGQVECHNGSHYNSKCTFSCAEGFQVVGSSNLQCLLSGEWTSSVPICQAVQCAPLVAPENGEITCQEGYRYKSQCSFTCQKGFTLIGASDLSCLSSGKWTSAVPKCEALKCTALIAPSMGDMNCTHLLGEFEYGSVCTFDCGYDLSLNGTRTVECDSSGRWSTEPPTCEVVKRLNIPPTYFTVGAVSAGASLMSAAGLLIWLIKRIRKTAKKFTPSSSYQHLEATGIYQNTSDSVGIV
ncbi:PREDICTED: P-selectin-like [Nanorana parkeri]|uniref:P-selectin-like n=1 Tax=Nanorana parkeri TaxID=125878 RepID=UPI000854BAE2|nr:PREDICTED: P-selectin-like [Nanorana parkeri]